MRRLALSAALASLVALTGCGGDDAAEDTAAAAPTSQAPAASTPSSSAPGSGGGSTTLTGTVGTEADADAFVITLTDASGQKVTSLPAGDYEIQVKDLSKIHNFHLTGGGVDETTTVPEVTDTTFDVTLTAGSYTFKCDPHPRMVGEFTVT